MDFEFAPVEDLAAVPEQFRPLYGDKPGTDGKFIVGEAFKGAAAAFLGLGRALKAERAAAKNRTTVDLTPLAGFGATVEEIANGVTTKIKELEEQLSQGGKINLEKVKQEFAQAHAGEVTKLDARNKALQGQLYEMLVENAATVELNRPGKPKGSSELLMPIIRKGVQVAEQDGKFSVFVVDQSGDRRYSGVTGQPMSISELIDEMRADKRYARAFDSDAPSGGGMPPGSGRGKPPATQAGEKTAIDKIKAGIQAGGLRRPGAEDRR